MAERDLPETARPWTDKLGNVWCAVPDPRTIRAALVYHVKDDDWKLDASVALYLLPEHLFAGLGRTLPPVPTWTPVPSIQVELGQVQRDKDDAVRRNEWEVAMRLRERERYLLAQVPTTKRVAKAVRRGDGVEVAARGEDLYFRTPRRVGWSLYTRMALTPDCVAAAHEAFQHAGDVLPGEEAE